MVPGRGGDDDLQFRRGAGDGELWIHEDCSGPQAIAEPATLHAVAALALHGQPFGFSHADVEHLRSAATCDACEGTFCLSPDLRDALEDLAVRIAALLPPRAVEPT